MINNLVSKQEIKKWMIEICLAISFSFFVQCSLAQGVQTITDRKDILIGEQIKLTIKAPLSPASSLSKGIAIPDSIPHFEMVETTKPDTINNNSIQQTILFTSFDSGRWSFPALPVEFAGNAAQPQVAYTDSFYVNVSYAPADSSNQLRDIKPIMQVKVFNFFWLYVAGGMLLLLLIALLLYFYFKKKKQDKPATAVSKLSAYEEAMKALESIAALNLQEAADIKIFHVRLAEIFKTYLGRKQSRNLFNKTTGELLMQVKETNASPETISQLATILRCTDAVKFAKYLPPAGECESSRLQLKEAISIIEQQTTNHQPQT